MTMETDGTLFAVNHDDDINSLWAFNTATPTMVVPVEEAIDIGPAKISINGLGNDLGELANTLEKRFSENSVVFRAASAQFLNVVPRAATKSGAISALLETADIPLADVLAFGDDYVDIDLIRDCGWSVAVDNAVPEIKTLAKYLTASNDDHGVALVLERLESAEASEPLFVRANALDPDHYPLPAEVDTETFEQAVRESLDNLPRSIREYIEPVEVMVEDWPSNELVSSERISPQILGIFIGVPRTGASLDVQVHDLDRVILFKKNLEKVCRSVDELIDQIEITVRHEIGHYLGLDEDDMERLGLA